MAAQAQAMYGSAPTGWSSACSDDALDELLEIPMYIGGGLLGTVLLVVLVVYLLRRA